MKREMGISQYIFFIGNGKGWGGELEIPQFEEQVKSISCYKKRFP